MSKLWRIERNKVPDVYHLEFVIEENCEPIAYVHEDADPSVRTLIAAAPDLLEAAKAAMEMFNSLGDPQDYAAYGLCRKAVEKASGGE